MRAFRFRLAALQRIKRYKIEEKEREIARLQAEIRRRLDEIDLDRRRLDQLRRSFALETPQVHSVEVEQVHAAACSYLLAQEAARKRQIDQLRTEMETRRRELLDLHREEKMLERLRDRQWVAWRKETEREEIYLLDEVGGQAHYRRREPAGGVMLVVLGAVALVAVAAAILIMQGKHKPILQRVGLLASPTPLPTPEEVPTPTPIPGEYTIRDLLGDPDRPANEVLSNLAQLHRKLKEEEAELARERQIIQAERQSLAEREKLLEEKLKKVQNELQNLALARQQEQTRRDSAFMQRVTEVSNVVQRMKPKGAADLLAEMWNLDPATDPQAREIVMEVFRMIPSTKRNKLLDEMVKSNKGDSAEMILAFIKTEPGTSPTPAP